MRRLTANVSISKQFLYDERRRPVKVILDYSEWLKVEQALGEAPLASNGYLLEELCGKFDFGGDPVEIQRQMRSE